MQLGFRELIKKRELLYMIAWRDIHIKYKQSIMGFMWAILMPTLIILTGVLVRLVMAKLSGTPVNMTQVASGIGEGCSLGIFCIFNALRNGFSYRKRQPRY